MKSVHQNVLNYKKGRYGLYASILIVGCLLIYLSQGGERPASGNTWQGYTLGGIATALIVFLMLLGIRKRRYTSTLGSVQAWTSAHCYTGTAVLLIVALHSSFQMGWNVHTLSYLLMIIVCISGFVGLWLYLRYPTVMTKVVGGSDVDAVLTEFEELNLTIEQRRLECPEDIQQYVKRALDKTFIRQGFFKLMLRRHKADPTTIALSERLAQLEGRQAQAVYDLVMLYTQRQKVLERLQRFLQIKAFLKLWYCFHLPCSFALLVALSIHIFSVFYYW